MNLYTIYDKMLAYYQNPFLAPDHNQVIAAIATAVNSGDTQNAIAQAPNHFEIWLIAEIDGNLVEAKKQLIADCSSLVRGSVRPESEPRDNGNPEAGAPAARLPGTATGTHQPR